MTGSQRLRQMLRRLRRDQRGNAAMTVGFAASPLLTLEERPMSARVRRTIAAFRDDVSGAVLIATALSAVALMGAVGIAVDVGMWYATKRDAQIAADAAAFAGAHELLRGSTESDIEEAAEDDAELNGFSDATGLRSTPWSLKMTGP